MNPAEPSGFFRGRIQQLFKQKSGSEPAGCKIQTDQMMYIPAAAAIVPGTESLLFQDMSGEVFGREDHAHISKAAYPKGTFFQQPADRRKDGCAAVDGKHPEGGCPFKGHITAAEGIQRGEHDFHAPAYQSAFYKIVKKDKQVFFHGSSHSAVLAASYCCYQTLISQGLIFCESAVGSFSEY